MRKLLIVKLLVILLMGSLSGVRAQHEADTWYFGDRTGFSFRAGGPAIPLLDGQLSTGAACAAISTAQTGQLLFYSNAERVWNRKHQLMPGGQGLRGSNAVTQGALIVPVPGDANSYYLFTLLQYLRTSPIGNLGANCELAYSRVNMQLAGGDGDVEPASKNTYLASGLTQKLTAVRHTNGRDYWVLVHLWGSRDFLIYPVTAQGIGVPRRQAIGPTHPAILADTLLVKGTDGQLQASPDGRRVACAVTDGLQPFSMFDFDASRGVLSNYVKLGTLRDAYGASFSPDNTKLYVQNFSRVAQGQGFNIISQYDMMAGDTAAIASSGTSIIVNNPTTNISASSGGGFYTLQNGPDGRMYGASWYRGPDASPTDTGLQTFYVINRPNALGFACEVRHQRYEFEGRTAGPAMPNFLQHYFNGLEPTPPTTCDPASIQLFPNPATTTLQVQLAGGCEQSYSLRLFNAVGQQVFSFVGTTNNQPINIKFLAAGLYLAEISANKKNVYKKVIIL